MSLLELQSAFRDEIVADDDGLALSSPGMAIYRDAYRGRLLAALESSFERTRRWTGDDAFTAAACHYILTRPPTSWTLDEYGADFPELLASLFNEDPEVAELAWLEWHMSLAFAAPDAPELDAATLAEAGLSDRDWEGLGVGMAAGFASRTIASNCFELWEALAKGEPGDFVVRKMNETALLVWRVGFGPRYRAVALTELAAVEFLAQGAPLGSVSAGLEPSMLGGWLANWLVEGLFSSIAIPPSPDSQSALGQTLSCSTPE